MATIRVKRKKAADANTGAPVDIFLTPVPGGYKIDYDQGAGLTLSEYKRLQQAIAQLRHSLRGRGHITIPVELTACQKLAERVGLERKGNGFNGVSYELPDKPER